MLSNTTITLIEQRVSANQFDPVQTLNDAKIEELVGLATRAPSAYNLQNWRFIAVRTPQAKTRLRQLAYDQAKVADAAVTFIVCGQLPDYRTLVERLFPFIQAGHMPERVAMAWQDSARALYTNAQTSRDEAIHSATLAAATLIYAAEASDLVSGPMVGFDAAAVTQEFDLGPDEIPVMLLAVGPRAPGNWPQKPRRPLAEVLELR